MKTTKERAFWLCRTSDGFADCGYTHRTREAAEDCRRRDNATIRRLYGRASYSELSAVPGNDAARREDALSDDARG